MVSVPRAAELVAQEVRADIIAGTVTPGDRLGSTLELQAQFGVSGPTVREALRILEAESLVEMVRGRNGGAVARRPNENHVLRGLSMLLQSRKVTLGDIYDARTLIEPAAVRRLAEMPKRNAALRRLRRLVAAQEGVIDDAMAFAAANVKFHEGLVAEAKNKTLLVFCEMLHDLVEGAVAAVSDVRNAQNAGLETRRRGLKAQLRLLEMIEAGSATDAENYWRRHMMVVGQVMNRSHAGRPVLASTR
jgi:GntR family transcriptional repressor for pyruvate dehydrogenase complex